MTRTVGSIFSGVGGFELGFEAAGFTVAWQIENDRDAVSVLERHWPDVPRYGDVRHVDPSVLAPVDVVVFGSPCQDFSVAGKRAGLAGERSGLFGEATRIIAGLRPKPAVCVWENVPGALSSARGRDWGAALDALADLGALDVCWRVLDARHWGVPQRRRRVFTVADLGGERAASILFEPESGSGNPASSGAAGETTTGDAADGAGVAGFFTENYSATIRADVGPPIEEWETDPYTGLVAVASSDAASYGNGSPRGDGTDNLIAHSLTVRYGATEDGTGRGTPLVACPGPVAFHMTQDPINGPESRALGAGNEHGCSSIAVAIWDERNVTSQANRTRVEYGAPANTLHAEGLSVITPMAVRRLTPLECEKLQGWPPDHTRWRANGDEISHGPRYRMIGNGVVAPVARWLAERIATALAGRS